MNTLNSQPDLEADTGPSLLAVLTLVLWLLALIVGAIGLLWTGSPSPVSQPAPPEPVVAELVNPDPALLEQVADTPADALNSASSTTDPPSPPPVASPLALAAAPSALIAFAVPVDGPARIVSAAQAAPALKPAAPVPVVVHHLVFGQGEGRQPAPAYPPQAVIEGQEGVVVVRFTVGEDGQVITAEVEAPSRWPLLNQAALDVVRGQWRLSPGVVRTEDVRIRFQID